MILKRKTVRLAKIGEIGVIKPSIIEAMKSTEYYSKHSVVANIGDKTIEKRMLSSNLKKANSKVLLADAELVYILKSPIFDGLLEVVPLCFNNDAFTALAVQRVFYGKKNTFYIPEGSIQSISSEGITNVISRYGDVAQSLISRLMKEEYFFNQPNFSWVNN